MTLAAALASLVLMVSSGGRATDATVRVMLDGQELDLDVPGQVLEGRTFVPFRAIFEAVGAQVSWDAGRRSVAARRGDDSLTLTVDSHVVEWRGSLLTMDVTPVIVDGRTLVPLRFIGQALGIHVSWDGANRTVHLQSHPADPALALGTRLVKEKGCMACHTFGGTGGNVGPVLDGVVDRYGEEWLRTWLKDPQSVRQGSRMPNFRFTSDEIDAIITYLDQL